MELLLSIIPFRNGGMTRVCLDECISERLSSRTSCTVTLTKGKREYPFITPRPVPFKLVRKVICLNEFASSLSIASLSLSPRLTPYFRLISAACIFDSQLSGGYLAPKRNLDENISRDSPTTAPRADGAGSREDTLNPPERISSATKAPFRRLSLS